MHTNRFGITLFCTKQRPLDVRTIITRAKDVLPNIHRTQGRQNHPQQRQNGPVGHCVTSIAASEFHSVAARGDGSEKHVFCPWWPWPLTLTLKLVRARDQTRLPCEFGGNPFSGSWDIGPSGAAWLSVFLFLLSLITLTFDFWRWHSNLSEWARDQTRLPCESGANPFSRSGDIWCTNKKKCKKVTDSAKSRTQNLTCVWLLSSCCKSPQAR